MMHSYNEGARVRAAAINSVRDLDLAPGLRIQSETVDVRYDGSDSGIARLSDNSLLPFCKLNRFAACFTPGTFIATAKGERRIEDLRVGERVLTRDNGIQQITWMAERQMEAADFAVTQELRPVLIKAGALGRDLPERNTLVSPNHRVLVISELAKTHFGQDEVLVAAKDLTVLEGVDVVNVPGTTYIHFMCDKHQVVLTNGSWTETFQPSDKSLKKIDAAQREELFQIYPELATKEGLKNYRAARKSVRRRDTFLLWR